MLGNLSGAPEAPDDGFCVHAIVKRDLTSEVKCHLAPLVGLSGTLWRMIKFDADGDFLDAHKTEIGKRMEQSIRLAKMSKSYIASEMGVSRAAVTQYCQGGGIALPRLARFCQITKASMDYIIFGTLPELETSLAPMIADLLKKQRTGAVKT